MKTAFQIADYVKRNRYGNFLSIDKLTEHFKHISMNLKPHEKIYSAFVGTVYSIPKHFIGISDDRLFVYSLEKKKASSGLQTYDLEDIVKIEINDKTKGIIRFYLTDRELEFRAEPCYSKRIALELIDTVNRLERKKKES